MRIYITDILVVIQSFLFGSYQLKLNYPTFPFLMGTCSNDNMITSDLRRDPIDVFKNDVKEPTVDMALFGLRWCVLLWEVSRPALSEQPIDLSG